jgi:hypothetical protein
MPTFKADCSEVTHHRAFSTPHATHSQSYPQKLWNSIAAKLPGYICEIGDWRERQYARNQGVRVALM